MKVQQSVLLQPTPLGDLLDIDNGSTAWQVRVLGLSEQRGPAPVARQLYEETPEGIQRREQTAERRHLYAEPADDIRGLDENEFVRLEQAVQGFDGVTRRRLFHLAYERRHRIATLDAAWREPPPDPVVPGRP